MRLPTVWGKVKRPKWWGTSGEEPFVWHKSADEILDTLAIYCPRISDSRH